MKIKDLFESSNGGGDITFPSPSNWSKKAFIKLLTEFLDPDDLPDQAQNKNLSEVITHVFYTDAVTGGSRKTGWEFAVAFKDESFINNMIDDDSEEAKAIKAKLKARADKSNSVAVYRMLVTPMVAMEGLEFEVIHYGRPDKMPAGDVADGFSDSVELR